MADEFSRDLDAAFVARLPVLGVKTTFATNSAAALDAIQQTYGSWSELETCAGTVSDSPASVRIIVDDRADVTPAAPAFTYRVPDPTRLMIAWDGGMGVADARRLESVAYVDAGLVSRRAEFAEAVLEPLTLFLLGALDREPIHAAAVARGDVAILLAAPSGTGKSTLAYAAWRHGFSLLADEPVYVQLRPSLRVWGRRARVHLEAYARAHFPELVNTPVTRLPNGKDKMVVDVRERVRRYADHTGICLLRRGPGTGPALERLTLDQIVAALGSNLEPGFDLFAGTIRERIERLAARGAWSLHLGRSPEEAVPLLDQVAAELAGGI